MPLGVLTRDRAYLTSGLLTIPELIILGMGLLLIYIILKKFAELHQNLSIKQYLLYIGVCTLPFFFTYPIEALDYYANLWYSERIVEYSENPYATKYSPENDYSHTDLPPTPESPYMPYGPVWIFLHTLLYIPIRHLPILTLTLIIKITSASILWLTMFFILRTTKLIAPHNLSTIATFGMSPLMLFSFVGVLHNDILFILFLALGVYAMCTKRYAQTLLWFTLSVFTKYVTLLIIPILLLWLWNQLTKRNFSKLVLPWLALTIPIGLSFVLLLSVGKGIANQSNLLGFTITGAFSLLTRDAGSTSIIATVFTGVFVMLYLVTLLSLRTELKQHPLTEHLTFMTTILLLLMFYYLSLFLYWYFMWLLPFIVHQSKLLLNTIAKLTYAYLFIFLLSWYLYLQWINGSITHQALYVPMGIIQLLVAGVAFYLIHRVIIIPSLRKIL